MKKLLGLFCVLAGTLMAQTVETTPFRAVLSSKNEVPAVQVDASGTATIWVHTVRDASGKIVSGSVDFVVRYAFPTEISLTGMHIHKGAAGANGGVVVNSGLTRVDEPTGKGTLRYQAQILPDNAAGLATLQDMLANPAGYYVNVHTTTNAGGAIRGQLVRAETRVLISLMHAGKELTPVAVPDANGVCTVMVIAGIEADGNISSAEVIFDANYAGFPEGTNFTGFHIHAGGPAANGPVVINTGLSGPIAAVATGGSLHYEVEANMASPASVAAVYALLIQPRDLYVNLHTQASPAGAMRGQLRNTDRATYQVTALPSNEVPPISGLDARAVAAVTLHTVRNNEGWVVAGAAIFDVNFRFPGQVQFSGMHIHDGAAGANGGVAIDSRLNRDNQPLSETGFGNVYRIATQSSSRAFSTMNSAVIFPQNHYFNMHTTVNAGGAVRAQLAAPPAQRPEVTAIISAVSSESITRVAPRGLMTIFGSNLFSVPSDSGGFESKAPLSLNGTSVMIRDKQAAIVTLGRDASFIPTDYMVVQVPADLAPGDHQVIVHSPNGSSTARTITVTPVAPGLYFDGVGAVAFHTADMTLIRPNRPAQAGEQIGILMTGLGPTIPPLPTGAIAAADPAAFVVAPIEVTIGGRPATFVASFAVPGFVGLDLVVVNVPSGASGQATLSVTQTLPVGNTPVTFRANTAPIAVQ